MYKLEGDYSWEACVPNGHTHTHTRTETTRDRKTRATSFVWTSMELQWGSK